VEQLNLKDEKQGDILRDKGIKKAIGNAENHAPGWQETALDYLVKYPDNVFQAEEVRKFAHENGLEKPPSARSWGSVIVEAKKRGLIKFVGYKNTSNPRSHSTPAAVWVKLRGIKQWKK